MGSRKRKCMVWSYWISNTSSLNWRKYQAQMRYYIPHVPMDITKSCTNTGKTKLLKWLNDYRSSVSETISPSCKQHFLLRADINSQRIIQLTFSCILSLPSYRLSPFQYKYAKYMGDIIKSVFERKLLEFQLPLGCFQCKLNHDRLT